MRVGAPTLLVPIPATTAARTGSADQAEEPKYYGWKMDLRKTAPFWRDWFAGLSTPVLDHHVINIETTHPGGDRSPGQGANDWPDAGQIPARGISG